VSLNVEVPNATNTKNLKCKHKASNDIKFGWMKIDGYFGLLLVWKFLKVLSNNEGIFFYLFPNIFSSISNICCFYTYYSAQSL
jgi:hypothetical protein